MPRHTREIPLPKRPDSAKLPNAATAQRLDDHTRVAREGDVHATYRLIRAGEKQPLDLTVAVFDLCDSTRFRAQYGAREAFARVERLNYIVEHWVQRHGGLTVKHLGDGVMASFPPLEHGDVGPIRAVRCAKDVIKTLAIPPAAFQYPAAPKVTDQMFCKVGIARGMADAIELSQGTNAHVIDYLGAVLDRAARVASVCRPNQVLVDEHVQTVVASTSTEEMLALRGPYEVPLKGLGDIKVFDVELGEAGGPRPDFNLAAVRKLASFREITESATRLIDAAVEDQRVGKTRADDGEPYVMILVDFCAFGSFSFPKQSTRYRSLLSKYARAGGQAALFTLAHATAKASSRLQFTEAAFREALKQPSYRTKIRQFGLKAPDYDALHSALLAKDAEAVSEFRLAGVQVTEIAVDPRLHVWIRGNEEAVVSFVMIEKLKQKVVDWNEIGFETTDRTIVAMLRKYVGTLIEAPL